jgi:hypothetical protein
VSHARTLTPPSTKPASLPAPNLAPLAEAFARYFERTKGAQISADIGLAESNVSRRFGAALRRDKLLAAFTGEQVLAMIVADAARGGDMLATLVRTAMGDGKGHPNAAQSDLLAIERAAIDIAHDVSVATEDGDADASVVIQIARKLRLFGFATASRWAPNLDAFAERKSQVRP